MPPKAFFEAQFFLRKNSLTKKAVITADFKHTY